MRVPWKFFTSSGISVVRPVTSISCGGSSDFFFFSDFALSSRFSGFVFAVVVVVVLAVVVVVVVGVGVTLIVSGSFFSMIGSSSTVGSLKDGIATVVVVIVVVIAVVVVVVVATVAGSVDWVIGIAIVVVVAMIVGTGGG